MTQKSGVEAEQQVTVEAHPAWRLRRQFSEERSLEQALLQLLCARS